MGHIVSHEGAHVDTKKIKSMMDWLIPKTLNNIQGLLGLTRYYSKFFWNYGRITTPPIALLKNESFSWTLEETQSFEQIKEAL